MLSGKSKATAFFFFFLSLFFLSNFCSHFCIAVLCLLLCCLLILILAAEVEGPAPHALQAINNPAGPWSLRAADVRSVLGGLLGEVQQEVWNISVQTRVLGVL